MTSGAAEAGATSVRRRSSPTQVCNITPLAVEHRTEQDWHTVARYGGVDVDAGGSGRVGSSLALRLLSLIGQP